MFIVSIIILYTRTTYEDRNSDGFNNGCIVYKINTFTKPTTTTTEAAAHYVLQYNTLPSNATQRLRLLHS